MFREVAPAVNDGERQVLQQLRERLPDSWAVIGNFEFPAGARWYECDALVVSPGGWGYLIETKHWLGKIVGNDHEWLLPALTRGPARSVTSPVHITTSKSKKLGSYLKGRLPGLGALMVQPLVVLVTTDRPELSGRSAQQTVVIDDLIERILTDPRSEQARKPFDEGEVQRVYDFMVEAVRPLSLPDYLGPYKLLELVSQTNTTETWEATLASASDTRYRVKRYFLDPLLAGADRERQAAFVRRDLEVLTLLKMRDGVVPLVGNVLEVDNSFVVATDWPPGRSLQALIADGSIHAEEAALLVVELYRSLAAVHQRGVTHRNLNPSCLYVADDRVLITDFDFARIQDRPGVTTGFVSEDSLALEYIAPEVRMDASSASPRSDVYSAAKIAAEALAAAVSPVQSDHLQPTLDSCLATDPAARPEDAGAVFDKLTTRDVHKISVLDLLVMDVIDRRFVVRDRADTTGGTAVVYRVYDNQLEIEYAAKFVRPELSEYVDVAREYKRLAAIPEHAGIIRPAFTMNARTIQRGSQQFELDGDFLLTTWVEGPSLADLLALGIPVARIMELGVQVADALEWVHLAGVVHRDVKLDNVVVGSDGRATLIDFNISATSADTLKTAVGTKGYVPAEIVSGSQTWTAAADVYALGVCLAELLAGRRLGNSSRSWLTKEWVHDDSLNPFRDVLLNMLADRSLDRPSASEAVALLTNALDQYVAKRSSRTDSAPPVLGPKRIGYNPYLDQLIRLYSQSSVSNAGTRGLDEFRQWLYVETKIDRELRPALMLGKIKLLVISGNAGDGKTAFIRMIEQELRSRGAIDIARIGGNGAELLHGGLRYVTNWDGSQDEGSTANDTVLEDFFEPFSGQAPTPPDELVAIIAINEGRLLDFLMANRERLPWLEDQLLGVLGGRSSDAPWLSVVNLNLRSLTERADHFDVVAQLLGKMTDARLWSDCAGCPVIDTCYAHTNAVALRDPVLGPRSAERIRQTLDIVRLRRRLHITMRDLMSALAYVVAGNRSCDEIHELVANQEVQQLVSGLSYNSLFAATDTQIVGHGPAQDRLLAELAPLDVSSRPLPDRDSRLWMQGIDALPAAAHGGERDRAILGHLWELARDSGRESGGWTGIGLAHSSLRRKYYFEREDPGYLEMFPYEHLRSFMGALDVPPADGSSTIVDAISRSEGLRTSGERGLLAVRLAQDLGADDRSFVTHSSSDFRLTVVRRDSAGQFVENLPDLLRLSHIRYESLALDIDLDLWEALMRIRSGFIPSREDLRGSWLSLQTFKERVASMPSRELLIQPSVGLPTRVMVEQDTGSIVARMVGPA